MLDFYQAIAQELEQAPVVLATVTHVKGSVPREVGAKMLVCTDGKIIGTIGGGAGEAKVYQQALKVLETGEKQWAEIDLTGAAHRPTQGICGGTMRVWLERWSGKDSLNLIYQVLDSLRSGQSGALVTPFALDQSPYLLQPFGEAHSISQITQDAVIEPLVPPPTLLILGAGHIAVPLAQIAKMAGFQVVVVDDRPDFASPHRFPAAVVLPQPVSIALADLPSSQLYAALVTRSYQHDLEGLRLLLKRSVCYLGMIGSEKRISAVLQTLQQEGYSLHALEKIHSPIGLDIGALTPEEIAVSICAELVKVRRGGTGRSLSAKR